FAQLCQVLILEDHRRALYNLSRGNGEQAQDRERRYALARAALAHNADGLALIHLEAYPADGLDIPFAGAESGAQVVDLEYRSQGLLLSHTTNVHIPSPLLVPGAGSALSHVRVEGIAQPIAHQVEAEHGDENR